MPLNAAELATRAGVNPWQLLQGLTAGDPAEISRLAAQFASAGGNTTLSGQYTKQAQQLAHDGFSVDGSPVPTSHVAQARAQLGTGEKLTKVAGILDAIADDLHTHTSESKRAVHTLNAKITTWSKQYDQNQNVVDHPKAHPKDKAAAAAANKGILNDAVAATRSVGQAVQGRRTQYDQALAGHRKALSGLGYTPPAELNEGPPAGPLPAPPKSGTPQQNRAWWLRLTPQQQQDLIQRSPRVIGNLNGLPAWARNAANRVAVKQDISSGDPNVRANASYTLRGLQAAYEKDDPHTGQPPIVQLYAYDGSAFGGEGRAAIAVGDIDKADNVVFSVPGIDNTGMSLPGLGGRAGDLYIATRNADPTQSTAVIAWLGYNTPINAPPSSEFEAKQGAALLAADVNGVRALREGDQPHITAVGHSYGSTVVARTAHDYRVFRPDDDIVLVGSIGPGTGVNKASELGVAPGHVYVGTAGTDATIYLGGEHGPDPLSDDFGAIRFAAETEKTDLDLKGSAHGSYFDPNSESLYNIAQVASGNGDQVIRETGTIRETTNPVTHPDPHSGSHDHAPHVVSPTGAVGPATPPATPPAGQPPVPAPTNAFTPTPVVPPAVLGSQRDRVTRGME